MVMNTNRERLLALLRERSLERGTFVLASGKTSDIYFDGKQTTLHPEGAYLVGRILFEMMKDSGVEGVGGEAATGDVPGGGRGRYQL